LPSRRPGRLRHRLRLHHAIADGVALIELLRALSSTPAAEDARRAKRSPAKLNLRDVIPAAASVGRILPLSSDPGTPLKGKLGPPSARRGRRQCRWPR